MRWWWWYGSAGLRVCEHDVGRAEGPAHVAQIPVAPQGEHTPCYWVIQAVKERERLFLISRPFFFKQLDGWLPTPKYD